MRRREKTAKTQVNHGNAVGDSHFLLARMSGVATERHAHIIICIYICVNIERSRIDATGEGGNGKDAATMRSAFMIGEFHCCFTREDHRA